MPTIAFATSLSEADARPFRHAVALALRSGHELVTVHANPRREDISLPDPSPLLRRWGAPPEALRHRELAPSGEDDPVETVLATLRDVKPDLVVAGTHARVGTARVTVPSVAEGIARNAPVPTLLFPTTSRAFVDEASGTPALARILVPVGDAALAERALGAAVALAELAAVDRATFMALRVGTWPGDTILPSLQPGWAVERVQVDGKLEDKIVECSASASLLVMATRGQDSVGDVLFGTHTERVLHRVDCPVLWVPLAARGRADAAAKSPPEPR
ncbi:MAG: universal stress protein [Sandaracinaceae bacterium]